MAFVVISTRSVLRVRLPQGLLLPPNNAFYIFWSPIFDILTIFHQHHRFHENEKDSWRNHDQFGGGLASVALLCVRIERIWIVVFLCILVDNWSRRRRRRRRRRRKNFWPGAGPHPIAPRDQISRSGKPLTPIYSTKHVLIGVRGYI